MRPIIFFLLLCCSIQLMAQSKQFVEFIGWTEKKIELQTISNRTKQSSCTFVVSSDSIRAFVFTGQQLRLMKQFGLARKGREKLLGGFMRDSSVYMFTEQVEKGVMHCIAFNVVTEEKKETFIRLDLARERLVNYISAGNHFIYVTANYRTKELSFYNFTNEKPGAGLRYQFSDSFWRELLSGFGGRGKIQLDVLDQEGDVDLEALARSNKLYITNDTLLLVMNNHIDSTYITCIDLQQFKAESWLIEHKPGRQPANRSAYSDNSFLFRNKLYYVCATNDSLLVQVADVYTGEILKTFSTERRDDITYKNTPFMEERTVDERRKDPKDLSKTSSFLRRMVDGNAMIMAKPFGNDQIEVMVGSYEKTIANTSVGGYPGFNSMPYGGYGYGPTMMRSPYYNNSYNPGRYIRSTWTNSTHFKMLLNGANFAHVPGEPGSSVNERIDRYTSKMKIDPDSESLFVTYGQHYYAYYDKGAYKLVVLKF
ncbi:hypothetical protein [Niastella sp. OAS944]|uniref:hypothetical protein n=1 Tax=Niastella sp. OAS944 TaxID=2664089 RepID=UPI00348FDB27|nr:hypothetical protein [Chitinophagaceae bacterium OAS944]